MKALNIVGVLAAVIAAVCLVAGRAEALRDRRAAGVIAQAAEAEQTRAVMRDHLASDIHDLELFHGDSEKERWCLARPSLAARGIPVVAMGCNASDGGCAIYNADLSQIEIYPSFHRHCFHWDHYANR